MMDDGRVELSENVRAIKIIWLIDVDCLVINNRGLYYTWFNWDCDNQ